LINNLYLRSTFLQ